MDVFSICLTTIGGLIIIVMLKSVRAEYAFFASFALGIFLLMKVFDVSLPFFDYLKELYSGREESEYFAIMLKSFAIAAICLLTSRMCRDMNESSLALKVELFGKGAILSLSLPIMKELLEYTKGLLK